MTTSRHLTLRNTVVQLLQAAPALAGGRVKPGRQREVMVATANEEIRVWLHTSPATRLTVHPNAPQQWQTTIAVHCMARDADGVDADTRADALAQAAIQRLMGVPKAELGPSVQDREINNATWEGEALDTNVADVVLAFSIQHRTPGGAF